ncbi:MAG: SGNH/GDSL hydrolase family protein, partial [Mesorhizobium sp.]
MKFPIPRKSFLLAAAAGPAFAPMQASFAEDTAMTNKIVLLGDSVFDNRAYVTGGADVLAHLVRQLPIGWSAD